MKDYTKLKDYRKKYKIHYRIEFDKNYEIHHIDCNRDNNEIQNLLLLPKKLHQEYHFYKDTIDRMPKYETLLYYGSSRIRNIQMDAYEKFHKICDEINDWIWEKKKADLKFGDFYVDFR